MFYIHTFILFQLLFTFQEHFAMNEPIKCIQNYCLNLTLKYIFFFFLCCYSSWDMRMRFFITVKCTNREENGKIDTDPSTIWVPFTESVNFVSEIYFRLAAKWRKQVTV